MCDFKPGDEVVYVGLGGCGLEPLSHYFVESVSGPFPYYDPDRGPVADFGLSIHGHVNTRHDDSRIYQPGQRGTFGASKFRKIQRRSSETGMAILKSICDNPGQLEEDTKHDQVEEAARMVFGPWGDYTDDGAFGLR